MAAKVGDTVRFLNDVGGGIVVKIKDNIAYVADNDGFETPVMLRECIVVTPAAPRLKEESVVAPKASSLPESKSTDPLPAEDPIEETDGGDSLNIVLAFEAHDLKRLSQSGFDAYLVNDSNYYLYFTFMSQADTSETWVVRHAGIVEPNFQLLLAEIEIPDLADLDRIALQIIAFKQNKEFAIKAPVAYESRLDTTKFAKLHCFRKSIYFDNPVISIEIVKDDVAQRGASTIKAELQEVIATPKPSPAPGNRRPISRKAQKNEDPMVVDLHINELIDNTNGLSNADMLNYQIDKFREIMDSNMRFSGRRIIFIHGKGEGVLRQALLKELKFRYASCQVQDASFREYGYGATQVTIRSDTNGNRHQRK